MKRPAYSSADPNGLRRFPKSARVEPLPPLPSTENSLERIRHTLIGHCTHYINTPWGKAAQVALDDVVALSVAT